ncbi:sialidase family protein [Streptomyces sp. NPDC051954]|uniref:sialidase family protein n=1 Tax=Streptomyces sp. NPDC051954 TaxID=3155524 RepID=UPI00341631F7
MPPSLRARLGSTLRALRSTLTAAAVTTAAAALPSPAHAQPATKAPVFEQQVLFKASQDPGYACFRIPAIVRTNAGTLLAFAEGRVLNCGDATDIDIVVKRSTDGGKTWGPLQVVNEGVGDTHGNPTPVVDQKSGRILLAETYNEGRTDTGNCATPCERSPYLQHSDDDGRTWTEPRDLSEEILPEDWNSWYATGPVHGIQLTRGENAGRIVISVNGETWDGSRVTQNHAALIVSDDGGDHWRLGAGESSEVAEDGTFEQKNGELTLAERTDGTILVSGRESDGTDLGHRSQAVSQDGGDSFATPFQDLPDLYAPQVQCSMLNVTSRLLLACPGDPDRRRTMMIRSSYDGGATWDSVDRGTVVARDWSGYSDLVHISGTTVGLMYEGGAVDARDEIRFARFTEDWLTPQRGPDPTTADQALLASPASVLGGPTPTDGAFDGALAFDGADDAVRLPYHERLPIGTRDFTASLWFRHTAKTGEQPLLSMGGVATGQPHITLRGEPASNRVQALMTAREGATIVRKAEVNTAGAYNDGRWHHLAFRRGGGKLTLFIDGETMSTADVAGSVSRNSPFGVHIGQRMDSRAFFTGAIDDVHVWSRALTDTEIAQVRTDGTGPVGDTVLWLPMDQVTGSD